MGASISFDSKYKLILDAEVECISSSKSQPQTAGSNAGSNKKKSSPQQPGSGSRSGSGSGSESGSGSGSGSESGSESESGSDSDEETKIFTVKITPEIVGYIRNYVRSNDFLDILDTITEIELPEYGHAPDTAIVFNSETVIFNVTDNKIEASGDWEYIEAPVKPAPSSKSSRKHKSKGGSRGHGDNSEDAHAEKKNNDYKTKEDELAVSEIETIISDRFKQYSKDHDFVIHESKTSILSLNIHSVEVVKN